jgi:hypothetical protein
VPYESAGAQGSSRWSPREGLRLLRNDLGRPEHAQILAGWRSADTSSREYSLLGDRWHLAIADRLEDEIGARNDQAVHVHADETDWRVFEQVERRTPRCRLGSRGTGRDRRRRNPA